MNCKNSILILVGNEVIADYKKKDLLPVKQNTANGSPCYHYKEFDSEVEKTAFLSSFHHKNLETIIIDDFDTWLNRWWNTAEMEIQILLFDVFKSNPFWEHLQTSVKWDIYNLLKVKAGEIEIWKVEEINLVKHISGKLSEIALYYQHGMPVEMMFDEKGCFYEIYQDSFNKFYDAIENRLNSYIPMEKDESGYETIKIVFNKPIHDINKMFDDEQWEIANLKGWIESYESSRFTQIDERIAIITSEYNMQFIEEWLMKHTSMDSVEII